MIKIKPDKEGFLTQWDSNRRLQITGLEDISNTEIHFSSPNDTKGAYVVLPVIEDGIAFAEIPNILLTVSGRIDVCVYRDDHTCVRGVFVVAPREKPDDYVYTETEVWRYEKFVEQLNGKEDTANRVTTVDDSSDDKHYPTAKAVYKAIPKSLKNPYSLTFTGAVTGSYDGSKPMTFNIPSGGAELQSGDKWEILLQTTLTEEVSSVSADCSDNLCKKVGLIIETPAVDADTSYSFFEFETNIPQPGGYVKSIFSPTAIPRKEKYREVFFGEVVKVGDYTYSKCTCFHGNEFQDSWDGSTTTKPTHNTTCSQMFKKYINPYGQPLGELIRKVTMWTYATFPVGTNITIIGVRA